MKPWTHQSNFLEFSEGKHGLMMNFDMGTGKTFTTILMLRKYDAKRVLVLCPKSVIPVWVTALQDHTDFAVFPLTKGTAKDKTDLLKSTNNTNYDKKAVIVNYETAWRDPLGAFLKGVRWDFAILDESHRIKAPGGKGSWFAKALGKKSTRRLCLTGTAMPHSPLDIYAQYRFLDPNIFGTSFHRFKSRYAILGGYQGRQVVDFQNLEELNQKFYSIAQRVMKDDVLDLPETHHIDIPCILSHKAMTVYQELEEELCADLDGGEITINNTLTKLLRLQQIAGGFIKLDEKDRPQKVDSAKFDALQDLIIDIGTEPVVVFCRFRAEIDMIREKYSAYEISGKCNELDTWNSNGGVLVVQIQAGGVGIDLTKSRYCIYYSLGFSLGDYEQSLARQDRPGQTRKVTYYHLIAQSTVDVKVYKALKEKKNVIDSVLDGLT